MCVAYNYFCLFTLKICKCRAFAHASTLEMNEKKNEYTAIVRALITINISFQHCTMLVFIFCALYSKSIQTNLNVLPLDLLKTPLRLAEKSQHLNFINLCHSNGFICLLLMFIWPIHLLSLHHLDVSVNLMSIAINKHKNQNQWRK